MEVNFHHRNSSRFPNSLTISSRENDINGLPAFSPSLFSIPEQNIAANNLNHNFRENFYDLVTELNHLSLSSPNQFANGLPVGQQSALPTRFRINSPGGVGGGSSLNGFDSTHFPFVPNTRYEDLQRMRVASAVREQMGMYMQFNGHGHGYPPNPLVNNSGRITGSFIPQFNSGPIPCELENIFMRQRGGFGDYVMPSNSIRNGLGRLGRYENLLNLSSGGRSWHGHNFTSLEELKGNIYAVAKDQRGCRFLQKILEVGTAEEIQMIYSEIKDHVKELMVDSFANYFIQKIFGLCRVEQITHLLIVVISDEYSFIHLCQNSHGTRAMQRLMEYITTPEQRSLLVSALVRITVPLTKCPNGNHVIQHCLKCLPVEDIKHILNVVADNCLDIATDRSGCCVLQQCVVHAEGDCRNRLLAEIVTNALVLSEDGYGNYVVQHVLSLKIPQVTSDILAQLQGSFVSLSTNKHGSNVVEKCMKESPEVQAMRIIEEIIRDENFMTLVQDAFGNYVAQSALAIAKGSIRQEMINLIQMHYSCLHNNPYGKRILAKARAASKLRV